LSLSSIFPPVLAIISAGLAASGTDWLLRGHPRLGRQPTFQHWLVPGADGTGDRRAAFHPGGGGAVVDGLCAFGGLLLVLVLVSEYIAVDPTDIRHGPASIGLTAVSYALFLILTITLVAAESRLYILVPALTGAIFLTTLRSLNLR
jgi:hypothetical protein